MTSLELLRLARNVLLRSFVIGFGLLVLLALLTMPSWSWAWWMPVTTGLFHINESTVATLVLAFFLCIRVFVVFGLLVPGLACHWTLKREEARKGLLTESHHKDI